MAKRVLIVEDSFGDRLILKDHLYSLGYSIAGEAKSIDESVEMYDKVRPDLVILDAVVPETDGISAIYKLLQLDMDACIILCVTRGQRGLAMEAMTAGAKDFVTKPINPRALQRAIRNAVG